MVDEGVIEPFTVVSQAIQSAMETLCDDFANR